MRTPEEIFWIIDLMVLVIVLVGGGGGLWWYVDRLKNRAWRERRELCATIDGLREARDRAIKDGEVPRLRVHELESELEVAKMDRDAWRRRRAPASQHNRHVSKLCDALGKVQRAIEDRGFTLDAMVVPPEAWTGCRKAVDEQAYYSHEIRKSDTDMTLTLRGIKTYEGVGGEVLLAFSRREKPKEPKEPKRPNLVQLMTAQEALLKDESLRATQYSLFQGYRRGPHYVSPFSTGFGSIIPGVL